LPRTFSGHWWCDVIAGVVFTRRHSAVIAHRRGRTAERRTTVVRCLVADLLAPDMRFVRKKCQQRRHFQLLCACVTSGCRQDRRDNNHIASGPICGNRAEYHFCSWIIPPGRVTSPVVVDSAGLHPGYFRGRHCRHRSLLLYTDGFKKK